MKLKIIMLAATIALATGVSALASDKDIVDTAVEAGQFKTLAAALEAAGLVSTLKGAGPFTVFAPTDEAFAKLPCRYGGKLAEAGEQAAAHRNPDLPCGHGKGDGR